MKNLIKNIMISSIFQIVRIVKHGLECHFFRIGRVNPEPIVVYGNQKSGTTAIASLLSESTALSLTPDFFYRVPGYERKFLAEGASVKKLVSRFRSFFSKDIIKEPGLSLHYDAVQEYFKQPKAVYIVRDPRENVKSILSRLRIPGDVQLYDNDVEDLIQKHGNDEWRLLLQGYGDHVVESLARRCNECLKIAEKAKSDPDTVVVKYEDFLSDKRGFIETLAKHLSLAHGRDIDHLLDVQFQPKSKVSRFEDYLSKDNIQLIDEICKASMAGFGY